MVSPSGCLIPAAADGGRAARRALGRRAVARIASTVVAAAALCAPSLALADPPAPTPVAGFPDVPIGLSNLLVRLDHSDEIGLANAGLRVQVLEHLRSVGVRAVGAENLVFDKDETRKARFMLGGTVRELSCVSPTGNLDCSLGVEWQVLDVERDAVVYTVLTRSAIMGTPPSQKDRIGGRLVLATVDSLLKRPKLREVLSTKPAAPRAPETQPPAKFASCSFKARRMPGGAEDLLSATVLIKTAKGFGSGVFLTSDGLVLTAAHVVAGGPIKLVLRDGAEVDGVVARLAPASDVALVRPTSPMVGQRCATLGKTEPPVGAEAYVAGAPADLKLAFSLTRGIISGVRELDGQRQLQTDAPVSPGNSGGPLADASGALVAVVTSKLVGGRVEGVAFGVPVQRALSVLGLVSDAVTDPALHKATAEPTRPTNAPPVADTPDREPSLERKAGAGFVPLAAALANAKTAQQDEERDRAAERDRNTPRYVKNLYAGGWVLAVASSVAVYWSYSAYDESKSTHSEFNRYRVYNTLGWLGLAGGVGMIITAEALRPPLVPADARTRVVVGPGSVAVAGAFR